MRMKKNQHKRSDKFRLYLPYRGICHDCGKKTFWLDIKYGICLECKKKVLENFEVRSDMI